MRNGRLLCVAALAAMVAATAPRIAFAQRETAFPTGWEATAPRDEIRPTFAYDPKAGPKGTGGFVLATDDGIGQHGWVRKVFPVVGGKTYRFHAVRKTDNVESPRRSAPARVVWQDDKGKLVAADVPAGSSLDGRPIPTAEPEHPLDGSPDQQGWTPVEAVYRAPAKATKAAVELHLQWAPSARATWSEATFEEASAAAPRKIRVATIHHRPSGKSPRANCEEFAPLIAEAAKRGAHLVVLGETVHYVQVGKKPHEVAEPMPGPSADYFCALAKEHGVHIVVSLYERDGRVVYNVALLIGPDGKIVGKYRKVCLPHAEIEAGVMPGNDYPVFDTPLGKIGMMVCYDGFFPEVARELAKRGAELIAWPVWGCDPLLAKARANENRVFIVSSTYMDPSARWMLSATYDRDGTPLAVADKWGSAAIADIDLGERRVGPYNLGDFGAMVRRHRPIPVPENPGRPR